MDLGQKVIEAAVDYRKYGGVTDRLFQNIDDYLASQKPVEIKPLDRFEPEHGCIADKLNEVIAWIKRHEAGEK
jgi:hypothetical protein